MNLQQRIAKADDLDDAFASLIDDCRKRLSILQAPANPGAPDQTMATQEQTQSHVRKHEERLRHWIGRRNLINAYRLDEGLPETLRQSIGEIELLIIRSRNSHFFLAHRDRLQTALADLFEEAHRIRDAAVTTQS